MEEEEEEEGEERELQCITVYKCSVLLSQVSLTLHHILCCYRAAFRTLTERLSLLRGLNGLRHRENTLLLPVLLFIPSIIMKHHV